MNRAAIRSQQGATLLVTLIMLIMLTLFAISAMNTSTTNLMMVGNMQARFEALDATQSAIDSTISTTSFIDTPANAIVGCAGANTTCTDLNGDGNPEYTTTLSPAPACVQARAIRTDELNPDLPDDLACFVQQNPGLAAVSGAATPGMSLCGQTVWEITARTLSGSASVSTSTVNVTATQGVGVRVKATDLTTSC
jgi:Tfp pilus assembly protein PilX